MKHFLQVVCFLALCCIALSSASKVSTVRLAEASPAGRLRVNYQLSSSANEDEFVLLDHSAFTSNNPPVMTFELYQSAAEARQKRTGTLSGSVMIELFRIVPASNNGDDNVEFVTSKQLPLSAFSLNQHGPLVMELSAPLSTVFPFEEFLAPHFMYKWRIRQAVRRMRGPQQNAATSNYFHPASSFAFLRIAKAFGPNSPSEWIERISTENLFRVDFIAPAAFKSLVLYTSGIGAFEAYVNGVRTNDHVLDPGTTDFAKYSLASVDDVTKLVATGQKTTLGFMLGNGWYGMPQGYGKTPKLRFELVADNNTVLAFSSPSSTKIKTGPISYDSIYNGETYSCSAEVTGWNLPQYSFSPAWPFAKAVNSTTFNPEIVFRYFPAIRINETLLPVAITNPAPGIQVVDFGREVSGFCEIVVSGYSGTITLHHGEIMDHYDPGQGKFVYFGNLRSALATDTYTTCPQAGVNYTYRPRFTYHGFRFVQVNTSGSTARLLSIKALAFFSAVKPVATFSSSHPTLNTLHQHILWGQTANLMSYPSDCDQRDERLGWMADGWLSSDEAISNFDMHQFYKNWASIIVSDQVNGMVGDVSPYIRYGSRPADPTWGMALPYIANQLWLNYADEAVLGFFYNASLQWVEYLASREASSGMKGMYAYYGDWVPPPPAQKATNSFVSAFSLVYSTQLVLDMAVALGAKEVPMLESQLKAFSSSFKAAWFNSSTRTYDIGVQTTFVLPMAVLGLVPFDVALGLLAEVEGTRFHLDTGIVGVRFLFDALSQTGHSDAALEIILQETYPGYAFEWNNDLETPATTLWELWDAPTEGPGMNSRNHIMDGSVDTWLHRHVGGIQQTMKKGQKVPTGFREVTLHADVAEFYSPVRGSNASRRIREDEDGVVHFSWQRHGGVVCEKAARGRPIELDCGSLGGVLTAFDFVSVGNPMGMCQGYEAAPHCHANSSLVALLTEKCLGKQRCNLPMWWSGSSEIEALERDRQSFAAPIGERHAAGPHCGESHITAAVRGVCSGSTAFTVRASVPAHTSATIVVPTFAVSSPNIDVSGLIDDHLLEQRLDDSFSFSSVTYELMTNAWPETVNFEVTSSRPPVEHPVFNALIALDGRKLAKLHRTAGIPLAAVAAIERGCVGQRLTGAMCAAALDGASNQPWRNQLVGIFVD
jgi:alpha-L-rhamnosidase